MVDFKVSELPTLYGEAIAKLEMIDSKVSALLEHGKGLESGALLKHMEEIKKIVGSV